MRIRTILVGYVVVQVAVFAVATAVVFASFRQVEEALRVEDAAAEVARGAFELSILTGDYLLGQGERPRLQWLKKHASLGRLLADTDDRALTGFATVRRDHATLGGLFDRLVDVEVRRGKGIAEDVAAQLERRLAIQLSSTSQSLFLGAERMARFGDKGVAAHTETVQAVLMIVGGGALVLLVVLSSLLARRISHALNLIETGIGAYARGELDHRIEVRGQDEIAAVASALNQMAGNLREATTRLVESRDGLAKEVVKREWAERELALKNDSLARSNQDLQQFAYVASHDLQEPLRAVSSYCDLLQKRYLDALDDRGRKYVSQALDGALRMSRMIDALLSFSRVTTSGGAFEPVDAADLLDQALSNLDSAIQEGGANVVKGPLPTVVADGPQIMRLFQNLVGNAIKFRNETAPEVHVTANRMDDAWEFSVRDNGIGIDPEYADRIFVIFQRLHGRDDYPGSGIGLAICKRIVERHGGAIRVASEPGGGADFRFTIPDK